jgi:16S rRNA (uracil1498-N3)-methyltransferase
MQRLYLTDAREGTLELAAAAAHYLRSVLRLSPGALLEVFDGRGGRWPAEVLRAGPEGVALRLGARLPEATTAGADVVLAQALAKGDKLDLIVQKATELGVQRIVPLAAERSVVRLDAERGRARAERWRRIAQEASRQCGRADVPAVDEPASWPQLFALLAQDPQRRGLLLDPEAEVRLSAAARGTPRLLLAVGPEGGFSPAERDQAAAAGLFPCGLGPRVLRTETVALAALAVLQHLHGGLG